MSKTRKASIINGFRTWLKTRITPKDTALTPTVRLSSFGVPLDGYSYTFLSARLHAAPGLCTLFCWLLCNLLLFILRTFSFRPCFAHLLSGCIQYLTDAWKRKEGKMPTVQQTARTCYTSSSHGRTAETSRIYAPQTKSQR